MSVPGWLVWSGVFVLIGLFIYFADSFGKRVSFARRPAYNRALAIGFPLLILVLWEVMVHLGYLNGRWFPPPSRITMALWDLIVTYDRFNGTSLLGRPWLIPSIWGEEGWDGAWALIAESHVLATLFRVAAGFVIGALPGILVGMGMTEKQGGTVHTNYSYGIYDVNLRTRAGWDSMAALLRENGVTK